MTALLTAPVQKLVGEATITRCLARLKDGALTIVARGQRQDAADA